MVVSPLLGHTRECKAENGAAARIIVGYQTSTVGFDDRAADG